jgi:transposase
MLAGTAPVPVSSGRTDRHRLNRPGDRQLNHAIHTIAVTGCAAVLSSPSFASGSRRRSAAGALGS